MQFSTFMAMEAPKYKFWDLCRILSLRKLLSLLLIMSVVATAIKDISLMESTKLQMRKWCSDKLTSTSMWKDYQFGVGAWEQSQLSILQ